MFFQSIPFKTVLVCLGGFGKTVAAIFKSMDLQQYQRIIVFDRDRTNEEKFSEIEFPEIKPITSESLKFLDNDQMRFKFLLQRLQDDPGFCQEPKLGQLWCRENFLWLKNKMLSIISDLNQVENEKIIIEKTGKTPKSYFLIFVVFGSGGGTGAGLVLPTIMAIAEIEKELNLPLLIYAITNSPYSYVNLPPERKDRAIKISSEVCQLIESFMQSPGASICFEYLHNGEIKNIETHFLCNHFYLINYNVGDTILSSAKTAASFIKIFTEKIGNIILATEANEPINFDFNNLNYIYLKGGKNVV